MILSEPLQITRRVVQEFEHLGIRYLVGGSLASSLHGIPRATNDVDIVAEIKNENVPSLVKALEPEFYIDSEMIIDAIHRQGSFNIIHLETMFKIDVFILKPDEASRKEMMRRQPYNITDVSGQALFLASAEDVVIHKLYWYKLGEKTSERQWNDVLGVLQVQGNQLDYAYLKQTAKLRGVSDLLEKALQEAKIDRNTD